MKTISSDWTANLPDEQARAHARLVQEARIKAITYLGLARKPSGQVARRLAELGYEQDTIQRVLVDLQADGYLDDLRLAQRIVCQRRTGRQTESRAALRRRLAGKGLAEQAIDEALTANIDDRQAALSLMQTRFANEWPTQDRHQMLKMARFLAGRGFSSEIVSQLIFSRYEESDATDPVDAGYDGSDQDRSG